MRLRAREEFQKRDSGRGFVELLNDLELALLNNAEELACLL